MNICRSCPVPSGPWTQRGLCNARIEVLWEIHQFVQQTFIEQLLCALTLLYVLGTKCVNKTDRVPVFLGFTFWWDRQKVIKIISEGKLRWETREINKLCDKE